MRSALWSWCSVGEEQCSYSTNIKRCLYFIVFQQSKEDKEPVVSVSSIHIEENSGVVITNSSLSVHDQDTPENEILFTIIRIPSYGEHRLHWPVKAVLQLHFSLLSLSMRIHFKAADYFQLTKNYFFLSISNNLLL